MIKRLSLIPALLILAVVLTGCYETVPPGYNAKIFTSSGYKPDILPASRVWVGWRERMVLLETSTKTYEEAMTVIMADKLTLDFDVRARLHIDGKDKILNALFTDISPKKAGSRKVISLDRVYETYGKMLIRNTARTVMSKYTVEDVHSNYSRISSELFQALHDVVEETPLKLSDVTIGKIEYPKVVTRAVEMAKKRQLEIKQAKADVKVKVTKKKGEEKVADANYRLEMLKAKTIRDANTVIAEGVTEGWMAYRNFEVQEAFAEAGKGDGNQTIMVPYGAESGLGAQLQTFMPRDGSSKGSDNVTDVSQMEAPEAPNDDNGD